MENYLLVFPEADPTLPDEWVHFSAGDSAFPTHDPEFVRQLLQELTTRAYDTGSPAVPTVSADAEVVLQLFTGTEAFLQVTVVNGGHNWPAPNSNANPPVADHFDATRAIVEFWRQHAGL